MQKVIYLVDDDNETRNILKLFLENSGYTKRQITTRINNIIKAFSLESIIDKDPFLLSEGEKQLVVLCSMLVLDLDILRVHEGILEYCLEDFLLFLF